MNSILKFFFTPYYTVNLFDVLAFGTIGFFLMELGFLLFTILFIASGAVSIIVEKYVKEIE